MSQSDPGAGFLSATTSHNCQDYNVAFGRNEGPPATEDVRMTIAVE